MAVMFRRRRLSVHSSPPLHPVRGEFPVRSIFLHALPVFTGKFREMETDAIVCLPPSRVGVLHGDAFVFLFRNLFRCWMSRQKHSRLVKFPIRWNLFVKIGRCQLFAENICIVYFLEKISIHAAFCIKVLIYQQGIACYLFYESLTSVRFNGIKNPIYNYNYLQ